MAEPLPGPRRLGRYELVEPLGQGGMGEVWLARLQGAGGFEKPFLVKTVLPSLQSDPQFVERFQHEARVLVHLQHSNVAQVFEMAEDGGTLFMVLEYVAGVDLARLLDAVVRDAQRFPLSYAVHVAQQVAEGLGYAHDKHAPDGTPLAIVHRDVSPHNVMMSFDGEVKLIDFGIARSAAKPSNTQAATVMGKVGYMAPEQARGEPLDARADQYAVGVLLWELLAAQSYVRPGSVGEMMRDMAAPQPRPVGALNSEVSSELEAVVQRALAADAAARFPRTQDLAAALARQLAALGGAPTREQLGAFVRARCGEAFDEVQRRLSHLAPTSTPHPAAGSESGRTLPGTPSAVAASLATPTLASGPARRPAAAVSGEAQRPGGGAAPGGPAAAGGVPAPDRATPTEVGPDAPARPAGGVDPSAYARTVTSQPARPAVERAQEPRDSTPPQEALEAAVRPSRAPLAIGLAGVLFVAGAGAWWLLGAPQGAGADAGRTGTVAGVADDAGAETAALPAAALDAGTLGAAVPGPGAPPLALDAEPAPDAGDAPDAGAAADPRQAGPARLRGTARVRTAPSWALIVTNTSRTKWTNCFVDTPDGRRARLPSLHGGLSRELGAGEFQPDGKARAAADSVHVRCTQGEASFPLR